MQIQLARYLQEGLGYNLLANSVPFEKIPSAANFVPMLPSAIGVPKTTEQTAYQN